MSIANEKEEILDVRQDFPVLNHHPELVYLDSGATALKPKCVIDKLDDYYNNYGVNVHRGVYQLSYEATEIYEDTRNVVASFLNCHANEVVYTKGASNGLNMVATGWGMKYIQEGDEIIVSQLEHHSNVLPWQNVAQCKKANLKYIPLDSEGRITVDAFQKTITNKTKVVAITYVSNVMGYISPVKEIIKIAHQFGAVVVVDAAQAVAHMPIDVKDLDVDFLAFSSHKMLGPTGFGILYGKYALLDKMSPTEFGGDMVDDAGMYQSVFKEVPYKFETGTPPIAEAIAFPEAVHYLQKIGFDAIRHHEEVLTKYALDQMKQIPNVVIYNPTVETGIISFNIKNVHPHDVITILDQYHIALRAGHHCAQLITDWLETPGTLRACIYIYNNYEDIDKFIAALKEAATYFKEW